MPLMQENFRDADRFLRPAVPGDQKKRKILPGRRSTCANHVVSGAALDQDAILVQLDGRILPAEERRIAPMRRCLQAIKQQRDLEKQTRK